MIDALRVTESIYMIIMNSSCHKTVSCGRPFIICMSLRIPSFYHSEIMQFFTQFPDYAEVTLDDIYSSRDYADS